MISVAESFQVPKEQEVIKAQGSTNVDGQCIEKIVTHKQNFKKTSFHSKKASLPSRTKEKGAQLNPILDALQSELCRELRTERNWVQQESREMRIDLEEPNGLAHQIKAGGQIPSLALSKNQSPRYLEEPKPPSSRMELTTTRTRLPNLLERPAQGVNRGVLNHVNDMFFPSWFKKSLKVEKEDSLLQKTPFKSGLATTYNSTNNTPREPESYRSIIATNKQSSQAHKPPTTDSAEGFSEKKTVRPQKYTSSTKNSFVLANKLKNVVILRNNFLGISNLHIQVQEPKVKFAKSIVPQKTQDFADDMLPSISQEAYQTYLKMKIDRLKNGNNNQLYPMPQTHRIAGQNDNFSSATDLMRFTRPHGGNSVQNQFRSISTLSPLK